MFNRRPLLWSAIFVIAILAAVGAGGYFVTRESNPAVAQTPVAAPIPAQPRAPAVAPRVVNLPHMLLQAQYGGPLLHTIIQRWRDPIDGTICYIYLPIEVHHSAPMAAGFVEYGAGNIGTISCMLAPVAAAPRHPATTP